VIDFAEMEKIVEWMRQQGVVRLKHRELEFELGDVPPAPLPPPVPLTDEQLIARAQKQKEQQDALLFASSEGFPDITEDE